MKQKLESLRRSRLYFTAVFSLLLLFTVQCSSFQPFFQKATKRSQLFALSAAKKNPNPGNKRKPRFSQHVYKEEKQQEEKQQRRPALSDLAQYAAGTPYPQQQQRKETTFIKKRPSPTYISPKVPWNSGKSVEELESIMTNRWGTDSSKWSEDDDDDDFEIIYEDEDSEDVSNTKDGSSFFFRPPQPQDAAEFYDPDDEGYESGRKKNGKQANSKSSGLNFDNIVAPKPAGGRGSKNAMEDRNGEEATRSGFFFQNQSADSDPARPKEPTQPPMPQREKANKPGIKPFVTDQNGNPILLTLEQAQRNFKAMIAEDSSVDDEEDVAWDAPSKSWEELGITSAVLLDNLQKMQCSSPLAVQDKACPSIITGQDVLVGTYTGSGKTLAFLVPLIERVLISNESEDNDELRQSVRILVVVPGRELASQVVGVARELLEGTGMKAMLAIGGTGFNRNLQDIRERKPSIIVGTPGRIAELIVGRPGEKGGRLKVPHLQSLVLDEFDALLEYKPHRDPTAAIVGALKQRHRDSLQSILCSATATDMLGSSKLDQYLRPGFAQAMADRDDVFVTAANTDDDENSEGLTGVSRTVIHGVMHVEHRRLALDTLRRILHTEPIPQQILIFVENARKVGIVVEKLENMGIVAAPLCGGSKSDKVDRAEVAKALREGYVGIVVATELAARGLDAPLLTHVINLDLPTDASHYAHRAGRCGRGGRPGVVINLTTSPQERSVPQKFANRLGVEMHTVEARAGKLHIVEDDA